MPKHRGGGILLSDDLLLRVLVARSEAAR